MGRQGMGMLFLSRSLSCWSRTDHEGPDTQAVFESD